MASGQLGGFIRHLKRMVGPAEGGGLTDAQLLERWVAHHDEAAFEVLLWRHGPMVLGVCRRLLTDLHEVDDAFQATFLMLVRRAAAIRRREALAGWLYQVAYRIALRARTRRQRRAAREQAGVEWLGAEQDSDFLWRDLRPVLDEEIQRLPDKYRTTFVLCYLQGQTNEEAAQTLGCPVGTVQSRLSWARERLRQRLTRRGITVAGALLVTALAQHAVAATTPAPLIYTTLQAALAYAAGTATAAAVSASALALMEGMVRDMFLTKLKIVAAVALALGSLSGAGAWAYRGDAKPVEISASGAAPVLVAAQGNTPPAAGATADQERSERRTVEVASAREGILTLVAIELKADEQAPAEQTITHKVDGVEKRFLRLRVGDMVARGQVLARLDDRLSRDEVSIKQAKLAAAEAELIAAEATKREAHTRLETAKASARRNAISQEELRAAEVTAARYDAEYASKVQLVTVAQRELSQARTVLEMHTIRAPAAGTLTAIYRLPGEAVKALEPVVQIRMSDVRK